MSSLLFEPGRVKTLPARSEGGSGAASYVVQKSGRNRSFFRNFFII